MPETGFQIENPMKPVSVLLLERTASRNLDKSALGECGPKGQLRVSPFFSVLCLLILDWRPYAVSRR